MNNEGTSKIKKKFLNEAFTNTARPVLGARICRIPSLEMSSSKGSLPLLEHLTPFPPMKPVSVSSQ